VLAEAGGLPPVEGEAKLNLNEDDVSETITMVSKRQEKYTCK